MSEIRRNKNLVSCKLGLDNNNLNAFIWIAATYVDDFEADLALKNGEYCLRPGLTIYQTWVLEQISKVITFRTKNRFESTVSYVQQNSPNYSKANYYEISNIIL